MPIITEWLEEPFILAMTYTGNVTVQEVEVAVDAAIHAADMHRIHFLVDVRKLGSMPGSVVRVSHARELLDHPNGGWFAIVGTNSFVKFFMQVFVRHRFKVVDTLEEGEAFLRERIRYEDANLLASR